ncbi:hypothetical protein OHB26_27770 [Nocardia sp. NBC_01503]|uniref:three-helix bundle dimerization domain-containing protein n=1 Tax=Nocardia sp. NBC_01503 TaxID=2975997 RepID=UPI002E7BB534|nr:hypothetical protein [Nocardia sp. NBC_01503]WTL30708.1 hypothetical protein OHB26_27770 [Nocardia sp. NBC_01503]
MRNDEDTQLRFVHERLTSRHPEVPPDVVAEVISRARAVFTESKVRSFVPLLVERRAARELAESGAR